MEAQGPDNLTPPSGLSSEEIRLQKDWLTVVLSMRYIGMEEERQALEAGLRALRAAEPIDWGLPAPARGGWLGAAAVGRAMGGKRQETSRRRSRRIVAARLARLGQDVQIRPMPGGSAYSEGE